MNNDWNAEIIKTARKYKGQKGGQCKAWAQAVIKEATGILVPRNDFTPGNPTDCSLKYQWHKAEDYKNISACTLGMLTAVKPGDIWQVLWKKEVVNTTYHIHTLIYLGKTEDNGIQCIDSNWKGDEIVREHTISAKWWDRAFDRGTVYRILKKS